MGLILSHHRRPGRLDRALGAGRQGLRRVHARRPDHAGGRLRADRRRLPARPPSQRRLSRPVRLGRPLCLALELRPGAARAGCSRSLLRLRRVGVSTAVTLPGTSSPSTPASPCRARSRPSRCRSKTARSSRSPRCGGRVGRFKIDYASLDDANPKTGEADPGIIASNARVATQDTSTIAYIGELDSAATAVSLPFVNGAGILQVSPASPYVGLTSSLDAGQDEPERFYPTGQRTFARLMPGDEVQAAAQVRLMRVLHLPSVYVIDDLDPFNAPLASIFAEDAKRGRHRRARRRPDRNHRQHGILRRGAQGARKRRPRGVLQRQPRRRRGRAVAAAARRRPPPAPARAEQPRRTLVRRRRSARRPHTPTSPRRCCRSRSTRRPRSGCSPNTAAASTTPPGLTRCTGMRR